MACLLWFALRLVREAICTPGTDVTENSENQRMSVPTTRARDEAQTREDTPLQNEIINNAVLLNLVQFTLFIIFY